MSRCGWFHTALSRWSHSYSNIVLHPKILFLQYFYSSTIRFGDFELVSSPKSSKISPSSMPPRHRKDVVRLDKSAIMLVLASVRLGWRNERNGTGWHVLLTVAAGWMSAGCFGKWAKIVYIYWWVRGPLCLWAASTGPELYINFSELCIKWSRTI